MASELCELRVRLRSLPTRVDPHYLAAAVCAGLANTLGLGFGGDSRAVECFVGAGFDQGIRLVQGLGLLQWPGDTPTTKRRRKSAVRKGKRK
jgi:hypothetical protein